MKIEDYKVRSIYKPVTSTDSNKYKIKRKNIKNGEKQNGKVDIYV
jgi:hypothetical protein